MGSIISGLFGGSSNESSSSSTQQSTSSSKPQFNDQLGQILAQSMSPTASRDRALADVQGLLRVQAQDALQAVMPNIAQQTQTAGAYNSTTKQLLQNDAMARINAQLAGTALDAIKTYGQLDNQRISAFADANRSSVEQQSQSTGTSSGSGSGSSSQDGLLGGLGDIIDIGSTIFGFFEKGGQVPDMSQPNMQQAMAGTSFEDVAGAIADRYGVEGVMAALQPLLDLEGITAEKKDSKPAAGDMNPLLALLGGAGFASGGTVGVDKTNLLSGLQEYLATGKAKTGESQVQSGGKIGGPQTKTGKDNQIIAVGGGEGIVAADVMKVPGVAELVKRLNDKYHAPQ